MDSDVRLLVLINPNNPTGNVASTEEIDKLLNIAKKWPNCMIVADEIYDGLTLPASMYRSITVR